MIMAIARRSLRNASWPKSEAMRMNRLEGDSVASASMSAAGTSWSLSTATKVDGTVIVAGSIRWRSMDSESRR